MNGPVSQYGSTRAQGQGVKKNVKSKFAQAKAVKSKSAKFDKAVLLHLLLFLLFGILMGLTVFIPYYDLSARSLLSYVFVLIALLSVLTGWLHIKRSKKKIEWYEEGKNTPKFFLALGAAIFQYIGVILLFLLIPIIFSDYADNVNVAMAFLIPAPSLLVIFPFLFNLTFEKAYDIEPKVYELWEYPENYIEKQPTWNRDRIIYSNLHFQRIKEDRMVTTIKVRLPKEAIFGELIYLFIKDYNENSSPDNPIRQLKSKEGVSGWLFWTNNKGIKAIFKPRRLIDINLSVEENKLEEECHIFFERVINET